MSKFIFLNVCLVLLPVVRSYLECSPGPITCHAGMYALQNRAKVTCNLHVNMTACQLGVVIVRYPLDAQKNDSGQDIASCLWDSKTNDHTCHAEHGYTINKEIDDRPTLEILSLSNNSAGFYMCYIQPESDTRPNACRLTPEGRPVCDTLTTPSIVIGAKNEGCDTFPRVGHIIAHVIMALMIILFFVFIFWKHHPKRCACRDTGNTENTGDNFHDTSFITRSHDNQNDTNSQRMPELVITNPRRRNPTGTFSTVSELESEIDGN